jgi:hypothetical protein
MDSKQPTPSHLSREIIDREIKSFIEEVSRPPQQPRQRRISEISFFCIAERRREIEADPVDL